MRKLGDETFTFLTLITLWTYVFWSTSYGWLLGLYLFIGFVINMLQEYVKKEEKRRLFEFISKKEK